MLLSFGEYDWALAKAISDTLAAHNVVAEPIAGDLPPVLPARSVQVELMGGDYANPGMGLALVRVTSRTESESSAIRLGNAVSSVLQILDDQQINTTATIVGISQMSLPYPSPDPRNPLFYVIRQTVQLTVKARPL